MVRLRELHVSGEFPLLVVTAPPVVTSTVAKETCAFLDEQLAQEMRFGICWDMSTMTMVGRAQRRLLMDFQKDNVDRMAQWVVAEAQVFRSPLVVGLITAIESVARSRHPIRTFENVEPAKVWVRTMLASDV